jgi:TPR repeat protein
MNVQLALEWYEKSAENGSKAAKISKDRLYGEGYKSHKKQNGKKKKKKKN